MDPAAAATMDPAMMAMYMQYMQQQQQQMQQQQPAVPSQAPGMSMMQQAMMGMGGMGAGGDDAAKMQAMGGGAPGGAAGGWTDNSGGGGKGEGKCAKKMKICTYFLQGTCGRGSACTFAHGEHEIGTMASGPGPAPGGGGGGGGQAWGGAPAWGGKGAAAPAGNATCSVHGKNRSMKNMTDDGTGGMCCAPGFECQTGGGGGGGGGADGSWGAGGGGNGGAQKKMKLCNYFEQGNCSRGEACTFAHGQHEIGTFASGPAPAPFNPAAMGGKGQMPGDWNCPACGDHQFARNTECRKCGGPNPNQGAGGKGAAAPWDAGASAGGGWGGMGGGDWGAAAAGGGGGGKAGGKGMMPGDWNCPGCGDHQFARNTECRKCGTPNPTGGKGGGKGDSLLAAPY